MGVLYILNMSTLMVASSGPITSLGASYEDGARKAKTNLSLEYDPENPKALRAWIIKAESSLNERGVLFALQEPPPSQRRWMSTHAAWLHDEVRIPGLSSIS